RKWKATPPELRWGAHSDACQVRARVPVLQQAGVGQSQGVCCPGDSDHFNLLAADVVGAVNVLRMRSGIDTRQIGLLGASQAGWIVPIAAVHAHVALTALVDTSTVTAGEERARTIRDHGAVR